VSKWVSKCVSEGAGRWGRALGPAAFRVA